MVCFTTIILGGLMPKFIKCFLGGSGPKVVQSHMNIDSLRTEESVTTKVL